MKKVTTVTSTVKKLERLNNSVNGNPRFMLLIDDNIVYTKSDASYVYNLENLINKECLCNCFIYETAKGKLMLDNIKEMK